MEHKKQYGEQKSFAFGLRALKTYKELIPLASIVSLAAIGICCFSVYCITKKSDIIIDKSKPPRWETIDPEKPQKLMTIKQQWKKIPELEELRKELGVYKP